MLVDDLKSQILINESQLGEKLNECVHEDQRSDFSLLLAMLTDDVRAHAQFTLPKTVDEKLETNEAALKKLYQVPEAQSLAINDLQQIKAYNQAELVNSNKLSDLHLLNAIKPNPIAFRNDTLHISKNILDNTSLYCQKKYKEESQGEAITNPVLNFNAKQWLNVINEEVLKSRVAETV